MNKNTKIEGSEEIQKMDGIYSDNKKDSEENNTIFIKNHSNFTKEGYERMNIVLSKSSLPLVIAAMVGLAIIDVFLYINKSWVLAGVISALVLVYPLILKFMAKRQITRTYKMYSTAFEGSSYDYEFKDDRVDFMFNVSGKNTKGSIKYSSVYQIIEDNDYLFLFISSNQVYIIEKKGFSNDDEETLLSHFTKKGIKVKHKRK